jgi:hypothetical protein
MCSFVADEEDEMTKTIDKYVNDVQECKRIESNKILVE